MADNSGEIKIFNPGTLLFKQGDPGGDLFFIREGQVEVFIDQENSPVTLAKLDTGEVLGLLTCVNRSARTATAKALTEVTTLVVRYEQFQGLLSKCPDWLKTILKELTMRITQMNDKYAQALLVIRKLKSTQVNSIFIGSQVASALPVIAPLTSIAVEAKKYLLLEETIEQLALVLVRPKEEIAKILEVFQNAGLVKVEIEPEKKRRVIDYEIAKRVPPFAQFITESRAGKNRKVIQAKFSAKDMRTIRALLIFSKSLGIELKGLIKLKSKDCRERFATATSIPYDETTIQRAAKTGIIELQGSGEDEKLVFAPSDLSRILVFAEAYGQLEKLDEPQEKTQKKSQPVKAA